MDEQLIRKALNHLYDPVHLQNSSLTPAPAQGQTKAQVLQARLLRCIEMLKPSRAHAALTHRYVSCFSLEETAERLGLSRRQTFRELEQGVKAVTSLMEDLSNE